MTKSEIVEALRCAADLCGIIVQTGAELTEACERRWFSVETVVARARSVGVEVIWGVRIESKRRALLEAAQRIEEGQ